MRVGNFDLEYILGRIDRHRRQIVFVVEIAVLEGPIRSEYVDVITGHPRLFPTGILEGSVGIHGDLAILRLGKALVGQGCCGVVNVAAGHLPGAGILVGNWGREIAIARTQVGGRVIIENGGRHT